MICKKHFFFHLNKQQQFGDLNEANGAVYTLENGQYQLPQYQVYAPMFQRPVNNQTSEDAVSNYGDQAYLIIQSIYFICFD